MKLDKYGVDIGRLCQAAQSARLTMRWSRERREYQVRQEAGSNWSEEASRERIVVNVLALYKKIVLRQLVPDSVYAMLSTFDPKQKAAVIAASKWYREQLCKTHFASTLSRCVHDALHGFGIMETGIATPQTSAMKSFNVDVGDVFSSRVDFDDWVWDIHARDPSECYFKGRRFRVPLLLVKDDPRYGKYRKELQASSDPRYNPEGDLRIDVLSRGFYGNDEEVEDMVDIWRFYLPRHNLIVELPEDCLTGAYAPANGGFPKALLEQTYVGPDDGPFTLLAFEDVPGNLLPKGPMMDLLDPHIELNVTMRKLLNQARRMKETPVYKKGEEADAKRFEDAIDGQTCFAQDPKNLVVIKRGGPDQNLFQFFIQFKAIVSWLAGNLETLGGLEPEGKTATEAKILNTNSSGSIQGMQSRVNAFTHKVLSNQLWYHWYHPTNVMKTTYSPRGMTDLQVPQLVHPYGTKDRNGQPHQMARNSLYDDIMIDLCPMISSTPQQRSAQLRSLVTQLWAPLQQQAAQQGVQLDFSELFEMLGRYDDSPDYADLFHLTAPVQDDEGAEQGQTPAPQTTTHVRQNVPQRTQKGNDLLQSNALRGIDSGGKNNGQMTSPFSK